MLKFEEIKEVLISDLKDSGLEIISSRNLMEMESLDRIFKITCTPIGYKSYRGINAEITFEWDCMYTSESLYGPSCDLYHDENVPCAHSKYEPEIFVELEIKYNFPVSNVEEVPILHKNLRNLIYKQIFHTNFPQIKFEVSTLPDGRLVVHDSYAYVFWEIPVNPEGVDFTDVFYEVKNLLELLIESNLFKTKKWE